MYYVGCDGMKNIIFTVSQNINHGVFVENGFFKNKF